MNNKNFGSALPLLLATCSLVAMQADGVGAGAPAAPAQEQEEGIFKVKWDQAPAKSRPSENRPETEYVRGTIYEVTDEDFEDKKGKRCIVWCEGEITPDMYTGKLQSIICDLRDEVQVLGSTQKSLVLANIEVIREITGTEAKADARKIMKAQNQNLTERGTRQVVRNAGTGQVSAQQEVGAILKEALGADAAAHGRETAALLLASNLADGTAIPAAALMLAGAGAPSLGRTNTNDAIAHPGVTTVGTQPHAGDSVVGGMLHHGQTVYPEREGVELKAVDVQPTMGVRGGADVLKAPGQELSPDRSALPGERIQQPEERGESGEPGKSAF